MCLVPFACSAVIDDHAIAHGLKEITHECLSILAIAELQDCGMRNCRSHRPGAIRAPKRDAFGRGEASRQLISRSAARDRVSSEWSISRLERANLSERKAQTYDKFIVQRTRLAQ